MTLPYRSALALAVLTASGLTAARPAAAQNLTGQPVNVTHLFPDRSTVVTNEGTQTIIPGAAAFTDGVTTSTVTPTQVTFTFTQSNSFLPATFNGFQIAETGTVPVGIAGVTLDPSSNLTGFDASRVSFDFRDVFANFQSLSFTPGNHVTLNLTFAPKTAVVPEPSQTLAFACGALGLAGLVAARRRRKQGTPGL